MSRPQNRRTFIRNSSLGLASIAIMPGLQGKRGLVYCIAGLAAFYCASRITNCKAVHIGLALFTVGHALIHVVEISIGLLPPSHWAIDFPLLFVPAILILAITPAVLKLQTAV